MTSEATKRVVIIDDNETNTVVYEHVVAEIGGFVPICFNDPLVALNWFETGSADIVVVDYKMPGCDGLEFVRRLRLLDGKQNLPIVLLTAIKESRLQERAYTADVKLVMHKPVDKGLFAETLRYLTGATADVR